MLHKKKPLTIKIKRKHITYVSLLLNTAIIGLIYGRKSNFIPTFSFNSALCIKYIKFSTSGVVSRAFGASK